MGLSWMAWTWETAAFFVCIAGMLVGMTIWELRSPGGAQRRGILAIETTRGDRLFISLLGAHSSTSAGSASSARRCGAPLQSLSSSQSLSSAGCSVLGLSQSSNKTDVPISAVAEGFRNHSPYCLPRF